jgi:hypothetical protein
VLQNFQDSLMFDSVKGFLKIQLYNNHFLLSSLAEGDVLKSPSQIVMDYSAFDETILI